MRPDHNKWRPKLADPPTVMICNTSKFPKLKFDKSCVLYSNTVIQFIYGEGRLWQYRCGLVVVYVSWPQWPQALHHCGFTQAGNSMQPYKEAAKKVEGFSVSWLITFKWMDDWMVIFHINHKRPTLTFTFMSMTYAHVYIYYHKIGRWLGGGGSNMVGLFAFT